MLECPSIQGVRGEAATLVCAPRGALYRGVFGKAVALAYTGRCVGLLFRTGVLGYKTDWLFRQAVGAVRCLFDFVEVPWGREKTGSRIMPVSLAITHCIYYKKRMQN